MPNIVTHAYIADAVFPGASPDMLLGSTLPDFLGMNRDYCGGTVSRQDFAASPEISAGIAFHYKTDDTYDALAVRKNLLAEAGADLRATAPNLRKGASRACADAGNDMLLDGVMLEQPDFEAVYERLSEATRSDKTALGIAGSPGLGSNVKEYFARRASYKYQDPELVATMLQKRFLHRRGHWLKFAVADIPAVAEVYERHIDRIRPVARKLIGQAVAELQDVRSAAA